MLASLVEQRRPEAAHSSYIVIILFTRMDGSENVWTKLVQRSVVIEYCLSLFFFLTLGWLNL